ncbi:MAG: 50S ribosomal protein L21 [Clostridia bacterium]|nr:50S ribosomal protein L21 [Clostridia bacterium]
MYAIIETGGKQYKVSKGDKVYVESLGAEENQIVTFEKVLAYSDGENLLAGTPYLKDIKVAGKVVKNGKGKKIIVFKFKAKKGYKKTQGHRQPYTCVEITDLNKAEKKAEAKKSDSE